VNENEARIILRALGNADEEAGAGREFYYEIETSTGVIEGLIVEPPADGITFVDVSGPSNEHRTVAWDDIRRVSVVGHT
jgi:hypothetical protein